MDGSACWFEEHVVECLMVGLRSPNGATRFRSSVQVRNGLRLDQASPALTFVVEGCQRPEGLVEIAESVLAMPPAEEGPGVGDIADVCRSVDSSVRTALQYLQTRGSLEDSVRVRGRQITGRRSVAVADGGSAAFAVTEGMLSIDAGPPDAPPARRGKASWCGREPLRDLQADAVRQLVHRALAQAGRLRDAHAAPSGRLPVVLAPQVAGTFAHEVVGHLLEGDNVLLDGAPLQSRMDMRVAAPAVTVFDDPTVDAGWGSGGPLDDEATPVGRTPLIEQGTLRGYLTDTATAGRLHVPRSGNARRATWRDGALARMTCTGISPGGEAAENLLHGIAEGVHIADIAWAQVDPRTGRFRLEVREGRRVRNGELAERFCGGVVEGEALTAMRQVEAVGRDFSWRPALCLKQRQEVSVSNGGPTVRLQSMDIHP